MKHAGLLIIAAAALLFGCAERPEGVFFPVEQMPDLLKVIPAPPAEGSEAFASDVKRYEWGKAQRQDSARAAIAKIDARWTMDSVLVSYSDAFGLEITPEGTPAIFACVRDGANTISQTRKAPKQFYHRIRPFEYFNEPMLSIWEEPYLRGEGSYPSGHTLQAWSIALVLAEINPDAAEALFARAWTAGESRVIVGAHWQSDVDVSRPAASIGFAKLQTSKPFLRQLRKARREYSRLTR